MKIEVELNEAYPVLVMQLKQFADAAVEAHRLFSQGAYKKAYETFPYRHPVVANLEQYVDDKDAQ